MTATGRRGAMRAASAVLLAAVLLGPAAAEDAPAPVEGPKHVDAALQRRIEDAIEGAVRWLRASVREDGSLPPSALTRASTYAIGLAALAGYAMRHGGVAKDDPAMVRVREFVQRGLMEHVPADAISPSDLDVYSAGLSIAFLLETTDDWPERGPLKCTLNRLGNAWTEAGWWGYSLAGPIRQEPKRRGDVPPPPQRGGFGNISTTLYAVFGLHAAARHGLVIDRAGLDRYMDSLGPRQMRDGGFVYLDQLPSQMRGARSYFGAASNAVAAYLLAGEATGRFKGPADALESSIVKDALPYLEEHFGPGVWDQPRALPHQSTPGGAISYDTGEGVAPLCAEDTYNLYATERIGMLLATETIGKVRWYERGARWLVESQRKDGHWAPEDVPDYPSAATTAFGLLFLARSVRAVGSPTTPRDIAVLTGQGLGAFRFDGATELGRLEWYDVFHRSLARFETIDVSARAPLAPAFARLGPRVVRALIFELESESKDRRRAANEVLVAVTGDDVGFDPDGDAKARAKAIAAWRKWLDEFEPFLVLDKGRIVTKPK